jgi:hypothetical protein
MSIEQGAERHHKRAAQNQEASPLQLDEGPRSPGRQHGGYHRGQGRDSVCTICQHPTGTVHTGTWSVPNHTIPGFEASDLRTCRHHHTCHITSQNVGISDGRIRELLELRKCHISLWTLAEERLQRFCSLKWIECHKLWVSKSVWWAVCLQLAG